jgi:NADH pyrophosphatase NudC (nudix superfamily)
MLRITSGVEILEEVSSCTFCQHCGAEIHYGEDKECQGCHRNIDECVRVKDVTSSIYPL